MVVEKYMKIKIIMLRNLLYIFISVSLLISCKSSGQKEKLDLPEEEQFEGEAIISPEVMNDIIQSVSSPVEVAALIKNLGIEFSRKYLAPPEKVNYLNTSFEKALFLGIYGADLGYLNMYNKTSNVVEYLNAINKLANDIKVGQFFDFKTLKRIAQSGENIDSLMYLSLHSFNQMDAYLRENNRSNLSALMVIGIWIEGLYLVTQVTKEAPHPDLAERVGEQKIILEKLLLVVKNFSKDRQFARLYEELNKLNNLYKNVEISIIPGEPQSKIENGMLVFYQTSKSVVKISDALLEKITQTTEEIRNNLIKS